jgi:hypothetical protein
MKKEAEQTGSPDGVLRDSATFNIRHHERLRTC